MDTEEFNILTINLFRNCEKSFVAALDAAHIPHGRMQSFTSITYASPVVEVISAPSSQMPWDTITTTIATWLQQKSGREVMVSTEKGTTRFEDQCSESELKEKLIHAVDILARDTRPKKPGSTGRSIAPPATKLAS